MMGRGAGFRVAAEASPRLSLPCKPGEGPTMQRVLSRLTATMGMVLAALGTTAIAAQDKYTLTTASGVAFADFRGYEGWEVVSVARTDKVLKAIIANPTTIE